MYAESVESTVIVCESKWIMADAKAEKLMMRMRYVLPLMNGMRDPRPSLTMMLSGKGGMKWVFDWTSMFFTVVTESKWYLEADLVSVCCVSRILMPRWLGPYQSDTVKMTSSS